MATMMFPVTEEELQIEEVKPLIDLSKSEDLISRVHSMTPPKTLQELDTADSFTSVLSVDAAAALKIPFGTMEGKFSRKIFVQDYLHYTDLQDQGQKIRWGVGIRWIVNIKQLDGKAEISSLPYVAASAQLGYVQAEARFQVLGLNSPEIVKKTPAPLPLNTETFSEMNGALKDIKSLIWDSNTLVKPKILAVLGQERPHTDSQYDEALAVSWALSKIKDGDTLRDALDEIKNESSLFEDTVRGVYLDIVKSSEQNYRPDVDAKDKARRLLKGLYMKI